jgi:hypothetical protein
MIPHWYVVHPLCWEQMWIGGARLSGTEREMCSWTISKYFGDLVSNTSA